ncbi:MAG: NAD-dependent deacylase [Prolixibacteraceae bacterium]|nr:NAD-dependent deacylase [Prolixibacteraceae bacterium]
MDDIKNKLNHAVQILKNSSRNVAFTGAGISVESGILPFRGKDGLWNKIDPVFLDINYFHMYPEKSWKLIKDIFYDYFVKAKPNAAHYALAEMEKKGTLQAIITQNIDNLHQLAGSQNVFEFHGNSRELVCEKCLTKYKAHEVDLEVLPPRCPGCGTVLKPDFVFFGEPIPEPANSNSFTEITKADVFILIGTTGEIMPASIIPHEAKRNGKFVIEVNTVPSSYSHTITDIFLQGQATEILTRLNSLLTDNAHL